MAHPITTFCERHNIRLIRFAGRVGVSPSTIYRLVDRRRRPSAELIGRISRATDGELTVEELHAAHFGPIGPTVGLPGTICNAMAEDEAA